VSTLDLFRTILSDQKTLPKDQAYKDLIALISFLLRKFFKSVDDDPFLLVAAFFPKTRGKWKAYSSLDPDEESVKKGKGSTGPAESRGRTIREIAVKKGYSWSEQVGIAIQVLVEEGKKELVVWCKDVRIHSHLLLPKL
jgi:replication fork protection complex subunit Tof1/Swi1